MKSPTLRQSPPTAPGLYWFTLGEGCVLRFCRVVQREDGVLTLGSRNVDELGMFKPVSHLKHRFWAGPLPEPAEPWP